MERVIQKITLALFVLLSASSVLASLTDLNEWGIKPNIGIDVGVRSQPFSAEFGQEQFRESYPESNIYIGAKFHPLFGIEVGYEHMYRQQKQQWYGVGSSVLGFARGAFNNDESLYFSNVYSEGWNVNLLGFWPICPRTKTALMGTIGIAWQKMYYSTVAIADLNVAEPLAMWDSDNRAMLRLGLGIRQMITKHFGARLQVLWEDTSKLDAAFTVPVGQGGSVSPIFLSEAYTVRPRDSYSVLLGFFFQIT